MLFTMFPDLLDMDGISRVKTMKRCFPDYSILAFMNGTTASHRKIHRGEYDGLKLSNQVYLPQSLFLIQPRSLRLQVVKLLLSGVAYEMMVLGLLPSTFDL